MEKEIMIPFQIFNLDPFVIQALKLMEDRKIIGKGRGFLGRGFISKTEEEFEKVTQDHQMTHPLFL
jgi:hypothetical protein